MVVLNRNVIRRVVASVDWGYTNPGVIQVWAVDGDGRMYLIHEVYQTKQLIGWWVDKAVVLHQQYRIEAFVCDPAEPSFIQAFRQKKLPAIPGFNEIGIGIQAVQERLKPAGDGRPRLYILAGALEERDEALVESKKPCCTAEEFDAYSWPKGQDGKAVKEIPVDKDNHGMDGLRYMTCYLDNVGRVVRISHMV
jgi:hypothetical protein